MNRTHITAALLLGALLGAGGAAFFNPQHAEANRGETWDALDLFAEVLGQIRTGYVEPVADDELIYAAVRGMFTELDPHSSFMDPEQYRAMRDTTRGEYVGVGIEVGPIPGAVMINAVFPGGPAADAGILAGDVFRTIDGESAAGFSTDDVVSRLRGLRGEPVTVGVARSVDGATEELTFALVRDVVRIEAVTSQLVLPGYGLVRITSFQDGVGRELRAAIDRLQDANGAPLDGLVLDLRDNPGGLLSEAIQVSDALLNDGTIVSTAGRDGADEQRWSATRSTTRFDGPLVVLVNGGTASASEIVAGALQDNGRAVVIGRPTFGKGSVQSIIDLPGGAGMKLTVSLYYTPSGRSIQGYGITPDLDVEPGTVAPIAEPSRGREAELEGTLSNPAGAAVSALDEAGITDAQLRAALQQLQIVRVLSNAAR